MTFNIGEKTASGWKAEVTFHTCGQRDAFEAMARDFARLFGHREMIIRSRALLQLTISDGVEETLGVLSLRALFYYGATEFKVIPR